MRNHYMMYHANVSGVYTSYMFGFVVNELIIEPKNNKNGNPFRVKSSFL